MSIQKLFLAWQNPETRHWFPIGLLTFDGEYYGFSYTNGVEKARAESNFQLLHSFPEVDKIYKSKTIFPLFANRLMPSSRPDYPHYINWLNISENEFNLMNILARSGGNKVTDTFEVFPYPEKNQEGNFAINFFIHGLRYMPQCSQDYIANLKTEEPLFLIRDCQNPSDDNALLLRTENNLNLGYCPRYLTKDIINLLEINPQSVEVVVKKINLPPAPIQLRLLCSLTAPWYDHFSPFSDEIYQPITENSLLLKV
jgi:hypothetical protein